MRKKLALALATVIAATGLAVVTTAAPAQAFSYTNFVCYNPLTGAVPTFPAASGFYVTAVSFDARCGSPWAFGNNAVYYIVGESEGFYNETGGFTSFDICFNLTSLLAGGTSAPRPGWSYSPPRLTSDCTFDHSLARVAASLVCDTCPRIGAVVNSAGNGASAVGPQLVPNDPTARGGSNGLAPEVAATIYGTNLAATTASVSGPNCQTTLGDRQVKVTSHSDIVVSACLTFVSANQINFYLPPTTPILGYSTNLSAFVEMFDGAGRDLNVNGRGDYAVPLRKFAMGLYSRDATGRGLPAAYIVRVHPDNTQTLESLVEGTPVVLGDDRVFLILYGTGIRFADRSKLTLRMGGTCTQSSCGGGGPFVGIDYVGAQANGLDQLNVELPHRADAVGDNVLIWLSADEPGQAPSIGRWSNVLRLSIQL